MKRKLIFSTNAGISTNGRMKRKLVFAAAIVLLLGVGAIVYAVTPGSAEDPVVSRSYVHARTSFSPVELMEGQRLIGGEGAEIILRSGVARVIAGGYNGVSDLTSGRDLLSGYWVYPNHLILVPRDDGRGILAETDGWVMVRGDFTIH